MTPTRRTDTPRKRASAFIRGAPAAAAFVAALVALSSCDIGTLPTEPPLPPGQPLQPQQRGMLTAQVSGDVSFEFRGGGIFVPGELGFRIRSQGHGELAEHLIDFHHYDLVGALEPGTFAIIHVPTFFQQGFTAFWRRALPGGGWERYTAVEGSLEITQSDWQIVRGSFGFQAIRTEVCVLVDAENVCQPVTGDQPTIEVVGELAAVPSRPR